MMDEQLDNLIMISALQHYVFCPRQCALIHILEAKSSLNAIKLGGLAA